MKPKVIVAILLIVLGVVAFAYQGVAYMTHSEGVNIGSLHRSIEKTHHIPLLPILGAIALVGGIALLLVDKRDFSRTTTR